MNGEVLAFLFVIVVAFLLVVCNGVTQEGFVNWNTNVPEGMCGVDLPPCPFGTSCLNGYCKPTNPPTLPKFSDLTVKPMGYSK